MQPNELKVDLTERELAYLKEIHNAKALKELTQCPGWDIYTGLVQDIIERLENQHLNFAGNASRDAYWASGLRLGAVREFAKLQTQIISGKVDLLNQPLRAPTATDPAEYDGYIPQNGRRPEGE